MKIQMTKVMADIAEMTDKLFESLKKHHPEMADLDSNQLLHRLSIAIESIGEAPQPLTEHTSEADYPDNPQPVEAEYNLAGDLLVTAYLDWKSGNRKDALSAIISTFECPDMDQLVRSIAMANEMSGGPAVEMPIEGANIDEDEPDDVEVAEGRERDVVEEDPETANIVHTILASMENEGDRVDTADDEPVPESEDDEEDKHEHHKPTPEQMVAANLASIGGSEEDRTAAAASIKTAA